MLIPLSSWPSVAGELGQKLLSKMDTNKMLIHHGLQVAPLPLFSSGGLLVPTPLPWVSPRVLLENWRLVLSPQRGCSPPLARLCQPLCIAFTPWFEYMQMLPWWLAKGNCPFASALIVLLSSALILLAFFSGFVSALTAPSSVVCVWERIVGTS